MHLKLIGSKLPDSIEGLTMYDKTAHGYSVIYNRVTKREYELWRDSDATLFLLTWEEVGQDDWQEVWYEVDFEQWKKLEYLASSILKVSEGLQVGDCIEQYNKGLEIFEYCKIERVTIEDGIVQVVLDKGQKEYAVGHLVEVFQQQN